MSGPSSGQRLSWSALERILGELGASVEPAEADGVIVGTRAARERHDARFRSPDGGGVRGGDARGSGARGAGASGHRGGQGPGGADAGEGRSPGLPLEIVAAGLGLDVPPSATGRRGERFRALLEALWEQAGERLRSPELDFEPLLPCEPASLDLRCRALGAWCSGFLFGFGAGLEGAPSGTDVSRRPGPGGDGERGEIRELLQDLARISALRTGAGQGERPGFREGEDEERDLAELIEFVRVAAQLLAHGEGGGERPRAAGAPGGLVAPRRGGNGEDGRGGGTP